MDLNPLPDGSSRVVGFVNRFEQAVYTLLLLLLLVVIGASLVSLMVVTVERLLSPPVYLLENHEILDLFGMFLLVLIGLEFLESIKAYLKENVIHFDLIIAIAITAIARKVILVELEAAGDYEVIGLGIVVLSLSAGYYLLRRGGIRVE
ncbi:MAG TPA: phosphate-starvation-inducible PsiE family protein [Methanoregulaceae archaeon]|nr:phosphate-starvation-inducible PsiE family protein [Methanoregulaceae archaeon]HOV67939.1 phosphate-starvation-inducible PsiE family protein [Methanoregulaceae archaeon]HQJ87825.1 phosphate-starvation-inducible PsiE family protein [Methanoregulaceae archaeon]